MTALSGVLEELSIDSQSFRHSSPSHRFRLFEKLLTVLGNSDFEKCLTEAGAVSWKVRRESEDLFVSVKGITISLFTTDAKGRRGNFLMPSRETGRKNSRSLVKNLQTT